MLWLALHFPLLPLESRCSRPSPDAGENPVAVVARGRVVVANAAGQAAGVAAGLRLSSALGLCPGLTVLERDVAGEQAALESLACWAGQFTPLVSLQPPATLALEIGGCLRLFGGLEALRGAVQESAAALGYSLASAVAPTPLAALWLAWAGREAGCGVAAELPAALADLPCAVADWGRTAQERLTAFGLATLGDLLRLPRAALGQRVGAQVLADLARALGELPDPRPWFVFPERFERSLELPARVDSAEMLAFAGQRLLAALAGWLAARGSGVRACRLHLGHEGSVTPLDLGTRSPTRDEARLLRLLREKLGRLELAAPVYSLALTAEAVEALPGSTAALFAGESAGEEGALACLERLQARLGEGRVHALAWQPDHRPECATGSLPPGREETGLPEGAVMAAYRQPLWLLPQPKPLSEVHGRPHWNGPLTLLAGPQRLESGWWDEGEAVGDLRRDYFIARTPRQETAWVFRDAGGWYLHGLFP